MTMCLLRRQYVAVIQKKKRKKHLKGQRIGVIQGDHMALQETGKRHDTSAAGWALSVERAWVVGASYHITCYKSCTCINRQ